MKYKFLYKEGNSLKFNGELMKIYLPKTNFTKKGSDSFISEYNGNFIKTMGIFLFEVTTFDNEEKGKSGTIYTMKLPISIRFEYEDSYTEKKQLKDNLPADIYNVFILNNGNTFIENVMAEMSINSCKEFIFMLHKGNLPSIIPYDEIIKLYLDTLDINGINLGSPSLVYEMIISEVCRSKNDKKIPFRKAINNGKISQLDYVNINMKEIPMLSSVYGALAFEDMNQSIITSINRTKNGTKEVESPIEKTIKY